MSHHVLRIGNREYRAEVKELSADRALVEVDGTEYAVDLVQLGRRMTTGEPPRRVQPATVTETVPAPAARSSPAARGEGDIVAPMPGLVLGIRVKEGESVTAGQALLVIEAMKMENAITAPYAGTVTKVYVREGDAIGEGDLLIHVSRPKLAAL